MVSDGAVSGDGRTMPYPGNDPTVSPGKDYEWRGKGDPSLGLGNWYNPKTGESLHPDLGHAPPIDPHWDYIDPDGVDHRVFPDGSVVPKQKKKSKGQPK